MTTGDLLAGEAADMRPLAERVRPRTLDDVVGQTRLLGRAVHCVAPSKQAGCIR